MGHRLRTTIGSVAAIATLVGLVGAFATATPAGASKAADVATARQGVLITTDFPAGWSGTRNDTISDAQAIKIGGKIPVCKDYVALRKLMLPLPEARSLKYDDGAGTQMANNVRAFASTAKATAALKLFGSANMADCLAKFTEAGAGSGVSVTAERTELSGLPSGSLAYTGNISDKTGTVVQQFRTIVVPVGRFVAVYNIGVTTANPPIDVIDAAAASSLTRLQSAA